MKKVKVMTMGLAMLTLVSGFSSCATKQGTGSLLGAGGGALIGGILGKVIGHDTKSAAIGAAIGGAVGTGAGTLIGRHMDKVAAQAAEIENAKVEEVTDANGLKAVKVTFDSGLLFDTNKATLKTASKNDLVKFAKVLKNNTDVYVDVYGHTDSTGNDGINIPLSNNRASSVVSYLKSCGVSAGQFKTVEGKGSSDPVADNGTAAGRQQNRRVEIYLYASEAMVQAAQSGNLN